MNIISNNCICSVCGGEPPAGCAHLTRAGWVCAVCGAPAISSAGIWSIIGTTVRLALDRVSFEFQAGPVSAYPVVRWFSRLRRS